MPFELVQFPLVELNRTAKALGVGRITISKLIKTGQVGALKIGTRTLITSKRALLDMRQLSFPVSTMSQWWVTRSSNAVVILESPKTVGHSPKARFVAMMPLERS